MGYLVLQYQCVDRGILTWYVEMKTLTILQAFYGISSSITGGIQNKTGMIKVGQNTVVTD